MSGGPRQHFSPVRCLYRFLESWLPLSEGEYFCDRGERENGERPLYLLAGPFCSLRVQPDQDAHQGEDPGSGMTPAVVYQAPTLLSERVQFLVRTL